MIHAALTSTTAVPVTLTDSQRLISTLDAASEKLMGSLPPASQEQRFVTEYLVAELRNAQLRAEGQVSTSLDPTAEAEGLLQVLMSGEVASIRPGGFKR